MSAAALGAAAGLRRALPTAVARASRFIQPAGFAAGRRHVVSAASGTTGARSADKEKTERTAAALRKQLKHIHDPWVLGKRIEELLAKDNFDDALMMVELASKSLQATVSWNHLIEYLLQKQQIRKAMSTFNNMKKRAQLPNAQTFTIIFRGLATSDHPKNAVTEAMKLFNQMKNDRRLQPNTIHLNSVLTVCSRALDVDHLFLVAAGFEDLGLAPTAATYGIIFNGLRQYTWREYTDLDKNTREANTRAMINRAKNIWLEVMQKWKTGKLALDERLVCSMGRVLLLAKDRNEKLQVLDLLEQTMNIPNLVAKSARQKSLPPTTTAAAAEESSPAEEVNVVRSSSTQRGGRYAEPGQNTLALILTTLLTARRTGAAAPYWNLLVNEQKLVPDNDNWLRLMGMLKQSKSSAQAAQFVANLPSAGVIDVQPRSFRIAMEACVRDNINPHAMANAKRVLTAMQAHLGPEQPDMHTMRLYLRVALVSHAGFRDRAVAGDEAGAKAAYGMQIAAALAELWDPYIALYNKFFKSDAALAASRGDEGRTATGILYTNQKEVIALGRMMVGCFSKVVEENMLPSSDKNRDMIVASAKINKGVQAFFADRELREPLLNKKATAARLQEQAENPLTAADDDAAAAKTSVFEIDMPELDDGVDAAKKNPNKPMRQGGDFVWNTSRPMGAAKGGSRRANLLKKSKEPEAEAGAATAASAEEPKPVIDPLVATNPDKGLPTNVTPPQNDDLVHIKPVADKAQEGASSEEATTAEKRVIVESIDAKAGSPQQSASSSVWATLLAKKRALSA